MTEIKKEKKEPVHAVYPATPANLNEIDLKYVAAYLEGEYNNGNINFPSLKEWYKEYQDVKKEKDTRFFMTFRKKFATTFFPHLYSNKPKSVKKPNALDEMFERLLGDK